MKSLKFILPIVLIFAIILVFIFQPGFLTINIYKKGSIPLGTLVSWIGIVAFAWILYLIRPIKKRTMPRIFRDILYSNFFAAVFWGFGSYLLAGNWQYNFTNKFNFYIWIFYTAVVVLLPVTIYLIWMVKRVAD